MPAPGSVKLDKDEFELVEGFLEGVSGEDEDVVFLGELGRNCKEDGEEDGERFHAGKNENLFINI